MKKGRVLLFGCAAVLTLLLGGREWNVMPDGQTHLSFLDVGQGDGTLITTPSGNHIVIDGGPDWSVLEGLGSHLAFFGRSIDLLVLSHSNLDHLVSFPEILKRYSVGAVVVSGIGTEHPWYKRIAADAEAAHVPLRTVVAGQNFEIDGALRLEVLWPPKRLAKTFVTDLNNASLIVRISDGKHAVLFTGDEEERVEKTLVAAHANLASDILKVAHHGSKTSSSLAFLQAVHPSVAVISVGADNTYGHPNDEVVQRIEGFGIEVRRTDQEGTIEIVW